MSSPLDFLRRFATELRSAGIRFAITSGMACVHYGLQQTTKDSDWIIAPEDLGKLRALLADLETATPPWRISYREICGAPLASEFMAYGWTSHLRITEPDAAIQKVDFFGKAPRVADLETDRMDAAYASRHVVALMKRTDRDRDWPIVDGLGWQLQERRSVQALLHIQDAAKLKSAWSEIQTSTRLALVKHRPLLRLLDAESDLDRIDAFVRIERIVWECMNQERYELFASDWKGFYRRWRTISGWQWPTSEPFCHQHDRLMASAREHGLTPDPVGAVGRDRILATALSRAARRAHCSPELIALVLPPHTTLLP